MNIFINAKNAMKDGGAVKVRTGIDPTKNYQEIIISDTGSGIPKEQLDKIFDPFFTTTEQGTGLA